MMSLSVIRAISEIENAQIVRLCTLLYPLNSEKRKYAIAKITIRHVASI